MDRGAHRSTLTHLVSPLSPSLVPLAHTNLPALLYDFLSTAVLPPSNLLCLTG